MKNKECTIFSARNISELFQQIKSIANLQLLGGCTLISQIPEKAISIKLIPDLRQISKHERYIDFGPGTTLSEILAIGERHLPKVLYEALKTIANPMIRNLATIGGNIYSFEQKQTLFAPLLALDAKLELKTKEETKYIPLQSFTPLPRGQIISNIRVPLSEWDVEIFCRVGPENQITENSASYAFLADTENNSIRNLRIAFAGKITFHSSELETKLIGIRLPLHKNDIEDFIKEASLEFDKITEKQSYNPILKRQFLNLIRYSLEQLT